jgi:hypothetical protein
MDMKRELIEIEARAKLAEISMAKLFEAARIHPQTYYQWKRGASPTLAKWRDFNVALENAERVRKAVVDDPAGVQ